MAVIELSTANFLVFKQTNLTNIKYENVQSYFQPSGELATNILVESIKSDLWFQHVVNVVKILNLTTGNVLSFSNQVIPRDYLELAENGLPIWHQAEVVQSKAVENIISYSQQLDYEISKYNLLDNLTIVDVANFQIIKAINIVDILSLRQGVSIYKESKYFYAV
jgi:hypothetical protein